MHACGVSQTLETLICSFLRLDGIDSSTAILQLTLLSDQGSLPWIGNSCILFKLSRVMFQATSYIIRYMFCKCFVSVP